MQHRKDNQNPENTQVSFLRTENKNIIKKGRYASNNIHCGTQEISKLVLSLACTSTQYGPGQAGSRHTGKQTSPASAPLLPVLPIWG